MSKKVHALWKEVSSLVSVAVLCTDEEFEQIKEVYLSHTNINRFKEWLDNNYVLLEGETVRVKK